MALLGLDFGTTSCKAAVFDENGQMLSLARRNYTPTSPQEGWAEMDPETLWLAACTCIREAVSQTKQTVQALAVSSQGEGFVPIDRAGKPMTPFLVSYDKRAIAQTQWLAEKFGQSYFFAKGGQMLSPVGTATKIKWLREHLSEEPQAYLCAGDYFLYRVGMGAFTDPSLAARTMLYDIHNHAWNEELADALEIQTDRMSKVVPSGTLIGTIQDKAVLAQLGLPSGTKVVMGGHDQPCALLGAAADDGAIYSLGTTETLVMPMDSFQEKLYSIGLCCYPHVVGESFVTLPGNFTGGNLLDWYLDEWGDSEYSKFKNYIAYTHLADQMECSPTSLLTLPHFTTTGSPWNTSQSSGILYGLRLDTKKGEIIRSLIEGIAYEIYLNLHLLKEIGIPELPLYAVGGGTGNKKMLQVRADVLGREILISPISQAACRGAALLAGMGCGLFDSRSCGWNHFTEYERVVPNFEFHQYYRERFPMYQKLYIAGQEIRNSQ